MTLFRIERQPSLADVAQLVEQSIRNRQVIGSSPIVGSSIYVALLRPASESSLPSMSSAPAARRSARGRPRGGHARLRQCGRSGPFLPFLPFLRVSTFFSIVLIRVY